MKVIINQFFGLGDILFIEPIYRHFHNEGYEVIAPVNPEHLWIAEYIPYVKFENKNKFDMDYENPVTEYKGIKVIPLRFAHPLLRNYDLHYGDERKNWMPDKYTYLGLDVELWRTLKFERNEERENKLFDLLDLKGKKYNFVNQNFGGSFEKVKIFPNNDLWNILLDKIDGYTLLDWGKVIENAENIYSVETSVIYYIESLNTKAKEFHLYPRMPFLPNVDYMKDLLKDKWIYHNENDI